MILLAVCLLLIAGSAQAQERNTQVLGSYPDHLFAGLWQDYTTPLNATNLNHRDDEIRSIEACLGMRLVPSHEYPLSDFLRVRMDRRGRPHLFAAHGEAGSTGLVVGPAPSDTRPYWPKGTLHVRSGEPSRSAPEAGADDIVVENSQDAGMTILSGPESTGSVTFGSDRGPAGGRLAYDAASATVSLSADDPTGELRFDTGAAQPALTIEADGDVTMLRSSVLRAGALILQSGYIDIEPWDGEHPPAPRPGACRLYVKDGLLVARYNDPGGHAHYVTLSLTSETPTWQRDYSA